MTITSSLLAGRAALTNVNKLLTELRLINNYSSYLSQGSMSVIEIRSGPHISHDIEGVGTFYPMQNLYPWGFSPRKETEITIVVIIAMRITKWSRQSLLKPKLGNHVSDTRVNQSISHVGPSASILH